MVCLNQHIQTKNVFKKKKKILLFILEKQVVYLAVSLISFHSSNDTKAPLWKVPAGAGTVGHE